MRHKLESNLSEIFLENSKFIPGSNLMYLKKLKFEYLKFNLQKERYKHRWYLFLHHSSSTFFKFSSSLHFKIRLKVSIEKPLIYLDF